MNHEESSKGRRLFLKTAASSALAATLLSKRVAASPFKSGVLQVWSCGGLAEAFNPANRLFEQKTGVRVSYTGAFAAALGKSLLGGATTEVFAGRVLKLAKTLREENKMVYFRPLCFTEYVMIMPRGNQAGIQSLQDLTRPDVRVILPLDASPPGGAAVQGILKLAGIEEAVLQKPFVKESCVIKMLPQIVSNKGDVSIVEKRLTRMPEFEGKIEVLPIPEHYFPAGPLTFTVGVMKDAKDRALADAYVDFVCSPEVQSIFEERGFIAANSRKGKLLIEKLGVKDV